jgi:hypothetical protein
MSLLLLSTLLLAPRSQATFNPEAAAQPAPRYAIEAKLARKITATMTWTEQAPNLAASEWIVYAASLPNMPGRQVNVGSTMNWPTKTVVESGPLQQEVLLAQVPVKMDALKDKMEVVVTYKAELYSRHLVQLPAKAKAPEVAALDPKLRALYVAKTDLIDFEDKGFQKWLEQQKLQKGAAESEVDFARRVYKVIAKGFTYEYMDKMDRHANAVCQAGKSDCGGLGIVFVAALRAYGIPARLVSGRWAFSAKPGAADPYQYHVKSEFFAEGIGWVPVDVSSGIYDKSPGGLASFGHESGDFLVMHFDHGLVLDTIHFGEKTATFLQTPALWATGKGSFEGSSLTQDWQVMNVK